MIPIILGLGYIACGVAAYHLYRADWLRSFDFKESDRRMMILLSCLGPAALIGSAIVYLLGLPRKSADRIIAKRKGR